MGVQAGALIVAVVSSIVAIGGFAIAAHRARKELRRAADDARRARLALELTLVDALVTQAARLTLHTEEVHRPPTSLRSSQLADSIVTTAKIVNHGSDPVLNVELRADPRPGAPLGSWPLIEPGGRQEVDLKESLGSHIDLVVRFTDSKGGVWDRPIGRGPRSVGWSAADGPGAAYSRLLSSVRELPASDGPAAGPSLIAPGGGQLPPAVD